MKIKISSNFYTIKKICKKKIKSIPQTCQASANTDNFLLYILNHSNAQRLLFQLIPNLSKAGKLQTFVEEI